MYTRLDETAEILIESYFYSIVKGRTILAFGHFSPSEKSSVQKILRLFCTMAAKIDTRFTYWG